MAVTFGTLASLTFTGIAGSQTTTLAVTGCNVGDYVMAFIEWDTAFGGTLNTPTIGGSAMTQIGTTNTNGTSQRVTCYYFKVVSGGTNTISCVNNLGSNRVSCIMFGVQTIGADTTTFLGATPISSNAAGSTVESGGTLSSATGRMVVNVGVAGAKQTGGSVTGSTGVTIQQSVDTVNGNPSPGLGWMAWGSLAGAASVTPTITYTVSTNNKGVTFDINAAASGIAFDAAANSGDQAASANYTFNRTVTGSNTFLTVDVELLTVTGATVTSVTDDDGGGNVPMVFIGARSTVTGAGRVECWGLANPTTGTKAIRVILSASIESVATAVSYTGVHQSSPYEGFNSNQATNAGSATDASVVITSVADNCWIHAACVANDTSITANQTTRNNVAGTLGSGANEDNNVAVTPAGNTTMSYTGMGITATWAIAGYAIRPLAASGLSIPQLATLGAGA